MIVLEGKYNKAAVFTDNIGNEAISQIIELCNQRAFEESKIRIMPDCHAGAGCVIGFTADLGRKIVPNLIGVDIGCGLLTVPLGDIEINFEEMDNFIRNNIPHGFSVNNKAQKMSQEVEQRIEEIAKLTNSDLNRHILSLGSLGGGNHFCECGVDSQGIKYLVIHSGSRNFGLQIAKYYQDKAIEHCQSQINAITHEMNRNLGLLKQQGRVAEIQSTKEEYQKIMEVYKVPKNLSFLEGELAEQYKRDMEFAQKFAVENRISMAKRIVEFLGLDFDELESFTTIHNYISYEDNLIRKGAISAKKGEKVLIPINMRDGSILAVGKGNEEWNYSAPHGAGRLYSRGHSKELFSLEEYQETMKGIYSTSVNQSTIDEAPMAYKPIDEIIENTKETIDIIDIIRPLYNFKA
ncbi:RtcB family protein [Alkaliphilus sp. B6464]|uniref:RtcB family protein n=1 Tax=Alkaliphilus sp. B6464 TaxID=2731219 RepID=UPI001BA7C306|nr:RtcB family protein [Alkaliphilus sp. B6464]QUH21859.1 RtcB family protein [Alkaliphilus sp. B6464]